MNIIELYINNLSKYELERIAKNNDIYLSEYELDFSYNFIKNNYKEVINNKYAFDFNNYKKEFSEENFNKIQHLIDKYFNYL